MIHPNHRAVSSSSVSHEGFNVVVDVDATIIDRDRLRYDGSLLFSGDVGNDCDWCRRGGWRTHAGEVDNDRTCPLPLLLRINADRDHGDVFDVNDVCIVWNVGSFGSSGRFAIRDDDGEDDSFSTNDVAATSAVNDAHDDDNDKDDGMAMAADGVVTSSLFVVLVDDEEKEEESTDGADDGASVALRSFDDRRRMRPIVTASIFVAAIEKRNIFPSFFSLPSPNGYD